MSRPSEFEAASMLGACHLCGDAVFSYDDLAETRHGWAHKGCQEEYDEEMMDWQLDAAEGMGD